MSRAEIHTKLQEVMSLPMDQSSSNTDPLLHELYIAAEGRSFFNKKYDDLLEQATKELDVASGSTTVAMQGNLYQLTISRNRESAKVDNKRFISELQKLGVKIDVINKAKENATTMQNGAKRIIVEKV